MSQTSFKTAMTAAGFQADAALRAPAMIEMTMIITRHAGRRRTS